MKLAAFFALLCACLLPAQPAQGAIGVGVADNTLLGSADAGSSFLALMNDIGAPRAPLAGQVGSGAALQDRARG